MIIFLTAICLLITGYFIYGKFVEHVFGADAKLTTPAITKCDNIDFVPLPTWRIFLIQFLNIAGLGPVFGAILGALYGPIALLWIVFGSIFAGAVHDYISGMISIRENGSSLVSLVEKYLGNKIKSFFLIFMIFFLLLVGAVFATSPAQMLANLSQTDFIWWIIAVFLYYFLATLLPIDKIIGRIYPLFALLLLIVSTTLLVVLLTKDIELYPNLNLLNNHPKDLPVFPLIFVTIACGALSGFHATQSPLMARCITNEKYARPIFYGAMITEGFIALIWATLGMTFYNTSELLFEAIAKNGPGGVVSEISSNYLGQFGGILAIIAVVILSITSGDTAFRSTRLMIGDFWKKENQSLTKRLLISIFVLLGGISLSFFELTTIWTYFGWGNQCLAATTLWMSTLYLCKNHKNYWITLVPAGLITSVCITYIMYDKIGFHLPLTISTICGICVTMLLIGIFLYRTKKVKI